ncbi:hypothetical protein LCGC14_1200640 [marine sediment metagenome]|uniref:Uncharacterized protein n=1 Tax=marine sediment metagenome TaxID=412755 RepID=A0A0F9NZC6_9ZZZZ
MSEHFHYIEDMSFARLNLGGKGKKKDFGVETRQFLPLFSSSISKPRESKIWKVLDAFGGQMEIEAKMLKLWGVSDE